MNQQPQPGPYNFQYAPPPGPPPAPLPQHAQYYSTMPIPWFSSQMNARAEKAPLSESAARPMSKDEDIQRLFKACQTGKGHASLLHEALVYAKPEDLKDKKGIIQEFRLRCRASQEFISSQIAWATSQAEQSRSDVGSSQETREEQLLADLLATNEELLEAMKIYDDLERLGVEQEKEERTRAERKLCALTAITSFTPTPAESELVNQIFSIADTLGMGSISSVAATKVFYGAGIPPSTLDEIWRIANVEENDMLSRQCVGVAVRLVGHVQNNPGVKVDETLVNEPAPLPKIQGLEPSAGASGYDEAGPSTTPLPPLTPQDRNKFLKIFFNAHPHNGMVPGDHARELFMKSRLPIDILAQIWELADTQKQGALDATGFTVAMYLIQAIMSGRLKAMPYSLPPSIYEAASPPPDLQHSLQRSLASVHPSAGPVPDSSSSQAGPSGSHSPQQWAVTPELKATADTFFNVLDEKHHGYLDGKTARAHFMQTGISEHDTQHIWRLVDINGDGRLGRDEFAVALHLIRERGAGRGLPEILPPSLVPPSMRHPVSPTPPSRTEALLIDLDAAPAPTPPPKEPSPRHVRFAPSPNASSSHILDEPSPPSRPPRSTPSPSILRRTPNATTPVASASSLEFPSFSSPPSSPISSRVAPDATATWSWAITPTEKARSDRFFDMLDPWKHGYIEGEAAVPFMSKSKLPTEVLGKIWDLADADTDGRLSKDDFAVAMHLIRAKLAGKEIPDSLPTTLVPPPLPEASADADQPAQQTQQISSSTVDLTGEAAFAADEEPRSSTPPPPYESLPSTLS
ncbi:unnamed protein product [Somion occarium]|uniref:Uncharacterized protein n=1 Tax=Somion occarium TaxID=3059160 RepID=A0ABP1DBQ0_9APHY